MTKPLDKKALYNLVWSKPMTSVAKEYGLSGRGLAKLCERNSIPVPPRGYWAKIAAGQKIKRPPLIVLDKKESETAILLKRAAPAPVTAEAATLPDAIQEAIDREKKPENLIKIPATMHNPHPIVDGWIKHEKQEAEFDRKYGRTSWRPTVTAAHRRGRKITNTLFKALEARGFKITEEGKGHYHKELWIRHEQDRLSYEIREYIRQYRRPLTQEEKTERYLSDQKWKQEKEPSGKLEIILEGKDSYSKIKIREEDERPFEESLNDVVIKIIEALWASKSCRLKKEAAERQRYEEERARYERRIAAEKEEKRKLDLEYKALSWKRAGSIREYIEAVEKAIEHGKLQIDDKEFENWRIWAMKHADDLDFIANGNPLVGLTEDPENLFESQEKSSGQHHNYSLSSSGHPWRKWYHS